MKRITVLLVLGCFIMMATPALAAYFSSITVTEDGTASHPMLGMSAAMDLDYMAEKEYISASGLDTRVTTAGNDIPHMLADDKLLFAYPVGKNSGQTFKFSTGNTPLDNFYLIVGYGGSLGILDDSSIELGDTFNIEVKGWVNVLAGSNKNILYKADAFWLYVSALGDITAVVDPGGSAVTVTASSLTSGVHIIEVTADGTYLKIFIDGNEKDSAALGGASVPDNANNWTGLQNNVMPYMEYLKIEVSS